MQPHNQRRRVPGEHQGEQDIWEFGPITAPRKFRLVESEGLYIGAANQNLNLRITALRILVLLVRSAGRPLSKSKIVDSITDASWEGDEDSFVRTHIREIRAAFENYRHFEVIKTSRSIGYTFMWEIADTILAPERPDLMTPNQPSPSIRSSGLHRRFINDFDWMNESDSLLATAAEDETIKIFSLDSHETVRTLTTHAANRCIASVPERSSLVYGTVTGDVRLWNPTGSSDTGLLLYSHPLVRALDYSPRHSLIASGGYDKHLRVYRLDRTTAVATRLMDTEWPDTVRALGWMRSDVALAFTSGPLVHIVSFSGDPVGAGDHVRLPGHTGPIFSLSWDSVGSKLATGDEDGTIIVWDTLSWRHSVRMERSSTLNVVRSLAFHPMRSNILAMGGKSGVVEVIQLQKAGEPRTIMVTKFDDFINSMCWDRTGSALVLACGKSMHLVPINLPEDRLHT